MLFYERFIGDFMTKGVVCDYENTLTMPFSKKGAKRCWHECGVGPEIVGPIIKNPFLEGYLDPKVLADCHQIFREEIEGARPNQNMLEVIKYLQDKNYEIFISSCGFADSIEKALKKDEFSTLNISMVFGREDGNKQEHLEKIRRIYDPEKIIIIGDDPADFENNAEFKIALNSSGLNPERFLSANVDRIINEPLTVSLIKEILP